MKDFGGVSCATDFLNKLYVGKQIRIFNTTQNWVVSKAFRSIAHQTWYMDVVHCNIVSCTTFDEQWSEKLY